VTIRKCIKGYISINSKKALSFTGQTEAHLIAGEKWASEEKEDVSTGANAQDINKRQNFSSLANVTNQTKS
jgi:hypothetical protein